MGPESRRQVLANVCGHKSLRVTSGSPDLLSTPPRIPIESREQKVKLRCVFGGTVEMTALAGARGFKQS